jgi:hypothetical protein
MDTQKKHGGELIAKTKSYKSSELSTFFNELVIRILDLIQSDERAIIKKVEYFIANIPAGKGCSTSSREYESLMDKNQSSVSSMIIIIVFGML